MSYIVLIAGFVFLIKGADLLVEGASSLAKRLGVSDLVIGMTIVALGTSLPELIVSVFAAAKGVTGIAIGNVIGSNIANILLVLGVAAVISPVIVARGTVRKEIPFCLLAALQVALLPNDRIIEGETHNILSRIDGFVLLSFLVLFLYYVFELARSSEAEMLDVPEFTTTVPRSLGRIALGLIGLTFGGQWVVRSATDIAHAFDVSDDIIGLTIVAIGTSLPELATSAVAAYRRNSDIAVGNIVGSNIFNVFLVLAVTAIIQPLPFSSTNNVDVGVMIGTTMLLLLFMFTGRVKYAIQRGEGVVFLLCYATYIGFLVYRS
ncbi:MAG: calcium/sodium antiporter [Candidatus Hydrogenedentes bacterium]|nr:calcium/sodium antiporter [Candidatus Hydrogenedentota bacterium]